MSLNPADLEPGDWVLLSCPVAGRVREAVARFEGTFASLEAAQNILPGRETRYLEKPTSKPFREANAEGAWARFLMPRTPTQQYALFGIFLVEPDGSLREDEGRRVIIESRVSAD